MSNSVHAARDRAEELLQTLSKKARELLDAEDGLVQTLRALIEEHSLSQAELKKKLEELIGRVKASKIWERVKGSDTLVVLADYRNELERRVEDTVNKLVQSLPIVQKSEVAELAKSVEALKGKLDEVAKKLA